jgi:hypothetical protein
VMDASTVGQCPRCRATVRQPWVIIEYTRADGRQAAYAECRQCEAVVRPRTAETDLP